MKNNSFLLGKFWLNCTKPIVLVGKNNYIKQIYPGIRDYLFISFAYLSLS